MEYEHYLEDIGDQVEQNVIDSGIPDCINIASKLFSIIEKHKNNVTNEFELYLEMLKILPVYQRQDTMIKLMSDDNIVVFDVIKCHDNRYIIGNDIHPNIAYFSGDNIFSIEPPPYHSISLNIGSKIIAERIFKEINTI